jgi:hypothetical protein
MRLQNSWVAADNGEETAAIDQVIWRFEVSDEFAACNNKGPSVRFGFLFGAGLIPSTCS